MALEAAVFFRQWTLDWEEQTEVEVGELGFEALQGCEKVQEARHLLSWEVEVQLVTILQLNRVFPSRTLRLGHYRNLLPRWSFVPEAGEGA